MAAEVTKEVDVLFKWTYSKIRIKERKDERYT